MSHCHPLRAELFLISFPQTRASPLWVHWDMLSHAGYFWFDKLFTQVEDPPTSPLTWVSLTKCTSQSPSKKRRHVSLCLAIGCVCSKQENYEGKHITTLLRDWERIQSLQICRQHRLIAKEILGNSVSFFACQNLHNKTVVLNWTNSLLPFSCRARGFV